MRFSKKSRMKGIKKMVLLVADAQKAITNSDLYQFEFFEKSVKELIHRACQNGIEVIYDRHNDGIGCELTKGNEGFEIIVKY